MGGVPFIDIYKYTQTAFLHDNLVAIKSLVLLKGAINYFGVKY